MGKAISQDRIREINDAYLVIKTYSGVAKKLGVSPSTVKKYIIPDYVPEEKLSINRIVFNEEIKPFDKEKFSKDVYWGEMCVLSEEELKEIQELWKEISL